MKICGIGGGHEDMWDRWGGMKICGIGGHEDMWDRGRA